MGEVALQEGTVLSDSYRIVRVIGRGGMGEVYEAVHLRTGASSAIKVLADGLGKDEAILERFRREAEVTSRLRHPNIVKVFDFNRLPDGRPFLAMELLSGTDLSGLLAAKGALPLPRVASIVDQLSLALYAAHEAGVVHRDLKPGNIFIEQLPGSDRDLVRVLDFGISKLRNAPGALTQTAAIIGTPLYMSPEQATGQSKSIDGRSDQFSLATIIYELVTGRRAFGASDDRDDDDAAMAILFRVVHQQPLSWSSLGVEHAALEQVVLRGMAKAPQDRFPSIRDFGQAFVAAASGAPVAAAKAAPAAGAPAPAPPPTPPTMLLPTETANPDTTLSLATGQTRILPTGETVVAPARRGSRAALPVVAVVAAAAVITIGAVALRGSKPPAPSAPVAALPPPSPPPPVPAPAPREVVAPPAAAPREVAVALDQAPEGLKVWEGDRPLALPLSLPGDGKSHHLVFKAPGRRDLAADVTATNGAHLSLAGMVAEPPAGPDKPSHRPRHKPSPIHNEDI
jgi:serine/threonine-protein kinase